MGSTAISINSIPGFGIHTGFWINWSHGQLFGSTLTLNRRDGGLLTSFLALFITFVGAAFWRISCFLLHQYLSSEAPRDGIYHQRQAILRNAAESGSGFWTLGKVFWAWRKTPNRPYLRLLPLCLFTAACLAAFAIAGIFSSKIATSTGTEVLISSSNCGYLNNSLDPRFETMNSVLFPYQTQRKKSFVTYSQQCYSGQPNTADCSLYVQKRLPTMVDRNTSCPFHKELCSSEWGNLRLDTGLLDSNDHFGFNAPSKDRFQFRRVLSCAPLATEGFTNRTAVLMDNGNRISYTKYYYGMRNIDYLNDPPANPSTIALPSFPDPFTYIYKDIVPDQYWKEDRLSADADYSISTLIARYLNGSLNMNLSTFTPIAGLSRPDSEIMLLLFSANAVMFPEGTNDPLYSAHIYTGRDIMYGFTSINSSTLDGALRFYFADTPASTAACAEQTQVCNPSGETPDERCTPLGPIAELFFSDAAPRKFWTTQRQYDMFRSFMDYVVGDRTQITDLLALLGVYSLKSRNSLRMGIQATIPDNQWQLDIESMHSDTLSILQGNIFDFAAGPSDPNVMKWLSKDKAEGFKYMCHNQKVRSTAYTSFNTFGLCLTLIVGSIIIIVSYTIEPVSSWIQKRYNLDTYARLEWCTTETLQLQRLAHEELGLGGRWTGAADAVPVTESGQIRRLAVLDLSEPEHPRLQKPPVGLEEVVQEEGIERDASK